MGHPDGLVETPTRRGMRGEMTMRPRIEVLPTRDALTIAAADGFAAAAAAAIRASGRFVAVARPGGTTPKKRPMQGSRPSPMPHRRSGR